MQISLKELFKKMDFLEKEDIPFVGYKLPNSQKIHLIFQDSKKLYPKNFQDKGFLMSSFLGDKSFIIRKENHFQAFFEKKQLPIQNFFLQTETDQKDYYRYKILVERAVESIKNGNFQKVVLSRKLTIIQKTKKLSSYLESLVENYPHAFSYVMYHPKVGKWGASTPEILLSTEKDRLKTMSLAGTQLAKTFQQWQHKEKEEQKIVTDYIENQLKKLCKNIQISDAKTVQAGNLNHICSEIYCDFKYSDIEKIIDLLHPTPAVCGFPTVQARDFILTNEGYDREFYTGYCGLLNISEIQKNDFFVNLRCMKINENQINIYVGGGITSLSNPYQEWIETQNKSQTILQII